MLNNYITRTPKLKNEIQQQNDDELNELKKALEQLESKQQISSQEIDSTVESSLKLAFKNSCVINDKSKRDISLKIFDEVLKEFFKDLKKFDFTDYLNEEYLAKLNKIYESSNELYVLSLVQNFIQFLGKNLHNQIAIINSFLQIMELSFKHVNNDIKARGYEVWSYLIRNFAQEQEFLLKPKKLNLLLMPLTNKTKSTKVESVSKAKALAWICLINEVNSKVSSQMNNLIVPFFNFCFADYLNDITSSSNESSQSARLNLSGSSTRARRSTSTLSAKTQADILLLIGCEFYVSFMCNGNANDIPNEFLDKFKHIKLSDRNFKIVESLGNTDCWSNFIKYFFSVFVPNSSVFDANLLVFLWSKIQSTLEKYNETQQIPNENDCKLGIDQVDDDSNEDDANLLTQFQMSTIEMLNSNYDLITSHANKKSQQHHFESAIQKLSLHTTKYLFNLLNSTTKSIRVRKEIEKNIHELIQILLSDDTNELNYLNNLGLILKSIDKSRANDYELWLILINKSLEFFKSRKSKYNNGQVEDDFRPNYESLQQMVLYPYFHFKSYKIEEISDLKQLNTLTNNLLKSTFLSMKFFQVDVNEFIHEIFLCLHEKLSANKINFDEYNLASQLVNYLISNHYEFNSENLNILNENQILIRIISLFIIKMSERLNKNKLDGENLEKIWSQHQVHVTTILVNQIDAIVKLLSTFKTHKNVDKLLVNFSKIALSYFELFEMFSGHFNKKLTDHFDTLFDEFNDCLSKKLNVVYEYEPNQLLESLESLLFGLLSYALLKKTKTQKQKFISTWNSTFGKYTSKMFVYTERLRKSFDLLCEDIKQHSLTAISLPGFNSILNDTVSNSTMTFISDTKMDDNVIMREEESSISSSSVPVVKLIRPIQAQTDEAVDQLQPTATTKFSFSPASDKKLQFNLSKAKSPKTPSSSSQSFSIAVSGGTKRKLDLSDLIDQEPEENFVRIEEKKPAFFKTPLTEHQKEVLKEKSFIPLEIHNESSNLFSALANDTSTSCTQDFIDEVKTKKEVVQIGKRDDVYEFNNDIDELHSTNKRICVDSNKSNLMFVSKLKPEKTIQMVEVDKQEVKNDILAQDDESVMEIEPFKEENIELNQKLRQKDDSIMEIESVSETKNEESRDEPENANAKVVERNEETNEKFDEKQERRRSTRIKSKTPTKVSSIDEAASSSQDSNEDNNMAEDEEILSSNSGSSTNKKEKISKSNDILKLNKNGKITKTSNVKRSKSMSGIETKKTSFQRPELKEKIQMLVDELQKSTDDTPSTATSAGTDDDALPLSQLVNVSTRRGRSKSLAPMEPIMLVDEKKVVVEDAQVHLKLIGESNELSKENILNEESEQVATKPQQTLNKTPLEVISENELLEDVISQRVVPDVVSSSNSASDSDCVSSSETDDKLTETKFTKSQTPTASILKKRKITLNSTDLMNERDTPSKRRVSFCDSVQIEEIEPNANKSIFRGTPRMPNKKLVLSPYLNKTPSQQSQSTNASIESNLLENIDPSTMQGQNSPFNSNKTLNAISKIVLTPIAQSPVTQPSISNSPAASLLNNFFNNKQSFLSQRTAMIQQQMQQQTKNESVSSPMTNQLSSQVAESMQVDSQLEAQATHEEPIYPALKDCNLSVDKIGGELASSMWSSGIIQLLKSKNILTISDLCMLPQREINELPFKTPKIENFLKVVQKFQFSLSKQTLVDEQSQTIEQKSRSSTPLLGSLEEEMAKLEGDETDLNTSIECEVSGTMSTNVTTENDPNSTFTIEKEESSNSIDKLLHYLITSDNASFNINTLKDHCKSIEQSQLLKLLTQINALNLRLNQANDLILNHLKL